MRRARLVLLLALSCNAFDPNLGEAPFLCGVTAEGPSCPEGYTAVQEGVIRCVCELHPVEPDAGGEYECEHDENEEPDPNDTLPKATETGIGALNSVKSYPKVSVCPLGDIDLYHLEAPVRGSLITVDVEFDLLREPPLIDILGGDGISLAPAYASPNAGRVVYTVTTKVGFDFYAQVRPSSLVVNYNIRMTLTPPP